MLDLHFLGVFHCLCQMIICHQSPNGDRMRKGLIVQNPDILIFLLSKFTKGAK